MDILQKEFPLFNTSPVEFIFLQNFKTDSQMQKNTAMLPTENIAA